MFARVARGELYLCALSTLAPHLTPDNAAELLEACVRKSRRDVEIIVATRFPKPNVPDSIRRLPERTTPTLALPERTAPTPAFPESATLTPTSGLPASVTLTPMPALSGSATPTLLGEERAVSICSAAVLTRARSSAALRGAVRDQWAPLSRTWRLPSEVRRESETPAAAR